MIVNSGEKTMMPKYELIVYWSEDDEAFIAEVPELSGCVSDGATYKEALANVEVVIQEWIDQAKELGRPIPNPKGRLVFAQRQPLTSPFFPHALEPATLTLRRA
jgi:predicted RNase H-like HicB family nuclease